MGRIRTKNILLYFLFLVQTTCTEPFVIKSIDFDSVLVVESTLTDELKRQVVKLSRTIGLEEFGESTEGSADVNIEDSNATVFTFSYDSKTKTYLSDIEFQAETNIQYTLKIRTSDGRGYTSKVVGLPPKSQLEKVYAEFVSANGKEGIQVFVDSDNATGAEYFRYEYEETYKVRLPANAKFDWEIVNYSDFTQFGEIVLTPREWSDEEFCYPTDSSVGYVQTSTNDMEEKRITRFPIRFIDKENPVLRERYSILVRQYTQSIEAHTFYKTLADLSSEENLLSQGQPGFVSGNIASDTDPDEKVLGYFGAASVYSQRIYFDHNDFSLDLPPYFVECVWLISNEISFQELRRKLEFENYQVYSTDDIVEGPHYITKSECSKCTAFSTHIKPDYWED
ncbi:DUF4249 domain-containing protein [Maribacter sp. HTCC2170]|uniref:DUF4249 domain-containing protein n=1 Tax=Maribacter sp. (strain HTCC2170 / KCCM 42371) TaxID=313603 RepID=UPI00006BD42E|nr:DUF4249 domain-containing protein [Maribacter sp. HTCC2170]EAR02917.1 hypothetical protein FB2170_06500 [Maribacter sp. HTCC2170]